MARDQDPARVLLLGFAVPCRDFICNGEGMIPSNPAWHVLEMGIFLLESHRSKYGTKMSITATLSSKFQISIPKAVRDEQRWEAGQEFVFIPKGKGVLVMPVPEMEHLAGIAKGANKHGYRDRKDRY
jgi:AbrB family looped-hinge helix DNA binding protein